MMRIIILLLIFGFARILSAESAEYGVAINSTPVLNTPDFKAVFGAAGGRNLKTDRCGQVRELEYIALPGTVFTLLKKQNYETADIYQVVTDDYTAPPNVRLYVDGRFLKLERTAPPPRRLSLPPREKILSALRKSVGNHYVWGGNVVEGVPELVDFFYKGSNDDGYRGQMLAGLDCSGLLYQATGGWTPRNTSQLITFGQGVAIAGKQSAEIETLLKPLDLIVWNGHVIIILDQKTVIESRLECDKPGNGGVVITQSAQRISEIMNTRRPANSWPNGKKQQNVFVIRRWYAP